MNPWRAIGPGLLGAAVLASVACGGHTVEYRCEGGSAVTARYGGDQVRVQLPDTTMTLPHIRSADGARYGNDTYTFWTRGKGAFVMRGDLIIYRNCVDVSG